jgi:hypothetical protein
MFYNAMSGISVYRGGSSDSAEGWSHGYRRGAALEAVLAEPQPPGTLLQLVAGYGNRSLDHDPTDSGATVFLAGLVTMLRSIIDEAEQRNL